LDKFQKQIEEAQRAFAELDGELGVVNFNPEDPGSIEGAIAQVNAIIDERVGMYSTNPFVGPMIDEMKEAYRNGIIEKAAAARLEPDEE
jgi:hypothetical protein